MGGQGSGRRYPEPRLNMLRRTTDGRTVEEKMEEFLAAFVECGVVNAACIKAKISRDIFYDWKKNSKEFAQAFAYAVEEVADDLEEEAIRRATKGVVKTVYNKNGEAVGEITEYSDQLLIFLLKGWKNEKYGNRLDINKNVNTTATVLMMPSNGRELQDSNANKIEYTDVEYIPEIKIEDENQQGMDTGENVL